MSVSKTYSKTCSAVGSFSYAGNFKLYVKLTDKDGSSSTNKSTVDYNVYCQADGSGSLDSKHKLYFKINGKEIIDETKTITASSPDAKFTIAKGSIEVTHNSDGSKSIDFEASVTASSYGVKASTSGSFALEKIPRYFSSKPEAHKTGKTETTYTIEWSTSETCSKVVFYMSSTKKAEWTGSAKSGTLTVTGLTAGTSYPDTYIVATRKDSGLTTESTPTDRETYDYPHITKITTANLVVGDFQDVEMYNPIPRSVTLNMYKDSISDANKIASFTGLTSTKYSLKPGNDAIYKSIPNATSAKCIYTLVYGSVTRTASGTYTYKIKGTEKPTIKDFSISSTEYQSLTGDPKRIILGYSNVTATPSGAATANNYAGSIKEYKTVIGNASAKSSSASAMTIANVTTNRVVMSVTDSRGLSSSKTVDGIAVNYSKILVSSLSAKRNNNINPQSTLSFTISFWNQSFGAVQNSIKQIYYEYKKSSSSSWIRGGTTISSSNYTISGNKITGRLEISGDLDAKGEGETGFDINNSYNIRLYVQDQLSNHTLSTILTTGLPAIAIYGNKVSIGAKYDTSIGNALQVYGVIRSIDKTGFGAIGKTRTVGGSDYTGYFGIGAFNNQGSIALELQDSTGAILNRVDLTPDRLKWGSGAVSLYAPNSSGIYFNQYGNIVTQQAMTSGSWQVINNGNAILQANFSDNSLRTRSIYPQSTGTYYLGSDNYYWKNLYVQGINCSGNIGIGGKNTNDGSTTKGIYLGEYGAIQVARSGGNPYVSLNDVTNGDNVTWSKLAGENWCSNMSGFFNINYSTAQSTYRLYVNGSTYMSGGLEAASWIHIGGNLTVNGNTYHDNGAIRSTHTYNNDTVTNAANMYVTSGGWFRRTTGSSERWKTAITEEIEDRLNPEALYRLPIKQFQYKEDCISKSDVRYGKNILGFIAEDVAKIYEPAVQYDEKGNVEMWNFQVMIPAMLKLIQEQKQEINKLKNKIGG